MTETQDIRSNGYGNMKKMMSQADWEEAFRLRRQGATIEELCKKFGVNEGYMKAMTFKAVNPIDWGGGQALRNAGWSIADIAKHLRVSEEEVLAHTKEAKPKKHFENEWNEAIPYLKGENYGIRITSGKRCTGTVDDYGKS